MLTGSRPFTGTSQVEIAMAQVKEAPPELPERINPDLRRLVMMMLAKAPANRPRSAAVVARILDSIERGEEPRFGTSSVRASGGRSDASASASKRDGGHSSRKITSKANSRTANPISPTGTRTAAMQLAGVGSKPVTIRSSSTAASAPSARSAASANSASSASRDHRAAARRGTSTGQSVGRVSLPLLIVIAVVAIAIIVAILVATGTVSLGASTHSLEWTGADVSALLRKATVAS